MGQSLSKKCPSCNQNKVAKSYMSTTHIPVLQDFFRDNEGGIYLYGACELCYEKVPKDYKNSFTHGSWPMSS